MDAAAAERIAAAVGAAYRPERFDPAALADDLNRAAADLSRAMVLDSRPRRQARRQKLLAIARAAADLSRAFDGPDGTWCLEELALHEAMSGRGPETRQMLLALPRLMAMARSRADRLKRRLHIPLTTTFIALHLTWAYSRAFGRIPRISRVNGRATGPFVRFALAALAELGLTPHGGRSYEAETIAAALKDARRGRYRRARHMVQKLK